MRKLQNGWRWAWPNDHEQFDWLLELRATGLLLFVAGILLMFSKLVTAIQRQSAAIKN